MKKIIFFFIFLMTLHLNRFTLCTKDIVINNYCSSVRFDQKYINNEILITLNCKGSQVLKNYSVNDFPEIDCTYIYELTSPPVDSVNYKRIFKVTLKYGGREYVSDAINNLSKRDDIISVEPNYCLDINDDFDVVYYENYANNNTRAIDNIWGFKKIHADVTRDMANEISSGGFAVGILDRGIDSNHPAILNNIYEFLSADVANPNNPTPFNDEGGGHGTQIAGIICGYNVSPDMFGVCPNIAIGSLKYDTQYGLDSNYITTSQFIDAITYAATKEIKILNFSFGFPVNSNCLYTAIQQYNGLVVCSAGNGYKDIDQEHVYPACYDLDNIISVGAMDVNDNIWYENEDYGSNYGDECVDLFAPGVNIFTATLNNNYTYVTATSFAAPFVSGVAAMLASAYYVMNEREYISPSSLKSLILNNVTTVDSLQNYCCSGGYLNAESAFSQITNLNNSFIYHDHNATHHYVERSYGYDYYEEHYWVLQAPWSIKSVINPLVWICDKCHRVKYD